MKVELRKTKHGKKITYTFEKGDIALVDDIEDVNGFIGEYVKEVKGTSGEEYVFSKRVKITVTISS